MDDLDANPLYKAFMTKFKREFEIACRMSYIIAIPLIDSLENVVIDQFLANSHILMPSKLLKLHYTPLQVGYSDDIEIKDHKLIVHFGKTRNQPAKLLIVDIVAEQIGYNVNNKEYRTILLDKPLMALNSDHSSRPLLSSIFSPKFRSSPQKRWRRPPRALLDHKDCFEYLKCISHSVTEDLEADVKRLLSNYLILPDYLDDAATRVNIIVESYLARYAAALGDESLSDSARKAISLSVENFAIHLLHHKLMTAIKNSQKADDQLLLENLEAIRNSKLGICRLGAQALFDEFTVNDEILRELRQLPTLESPLELVSCLMRVVALVNEALNQSVRIKLIMGIGERASICSDDLIASFVFSLARAKPSHLYSVSKYLETFGWNSSARDQAAYYVATFQIVVQYVLGYTNEDDAKGSETNSKEAKERVALDVKDDCRRTSSSNLCLSDKMIAQFDPSPPPTDGLQLSNCDTTSSRAKFANSLDSRCSSMTEPDSSISSSSLVVETDQETGWDLVSFLIGEHL